MTILHGHLLHVWLSASRTPCSSHVGHLQGLTMMGTAILGVLWWNLLCNNFWPRKIRSRGKFSSLLHLTCDSGTTSLQHPIAIIASRLPVAAGISLFHVSHPLLFLPYTNSQDKLLGHGLCFLGCLGAHRGHHRLALERNTETCVKSS